jgi:hypothetical protein
MNFFTDFFLKVLPRRFLTDLVSAHFSLQDTLLDKKNYNAIRTSFAASHMFLSFQ